MKVDINYRIDVNVINCIKLIIQKGNYDIVSNFSGIIVSNVDKNVLKEIYKKI